MKNDTIQIGIDLGTTNSEIAINENGSVRIVKNIFGDEYTPSVFGIDKAKNKIVGKRAYEHLYKDSSEDEFNNNKAEIKRLMGTSDTIHFERANLDLSPEQISAEILKSLRGDVLRKYPDFQANAAVITVPAAFSVLQSEATKRAGNLAGFKHVVLLQEPIAAAVSCGFGKNTNENWLIYDLGGGTFDVAVIAAKDGILSVLGHTGDNFLGGKNFDWEIVDKVIVPQILKVHSLNNFNRANTELSGVFAKLKYFAENAKIELSQNTTTSIEVDGIGEDANGKEIYLCFDFTRKDLEKLIKPFIDRTIELSKTAILEAGIKHTSISKIVLVGGPTQIPYIKSRLETDLKIPINTSVDPLTIVAEGACLFASGQKIPKDILGTETVAIKAGTQKLDLDYASLTSDTEEIVTGILSGLADSTEEHYIQIQSDSGTYSGPKVKLKNGKFLDTVSVDANKLNQYWIYLFDKTGNSIPLSPDSFSITHGLSVSGMPLPHSISVAIARKDHVAGAVTNVCDTVVMKGTPLPIHKSIDGVYKTARKLKKGEEASLGIKVLEGESEIPDRNTFLTELGLKGTDLPYDLPEHTPIDLTFDMNESRELSVTAYIPLIDMTLEARLQLHDEKIDVDSLEADLAAQVARAKRVSESCSPEENKKLSNTIQSTKTSIANAHIDEDEKRKANKQIKDLKTELDKVEKDKEMPQLITEFNERAEHVEKIVNEYADEKSKKENLEQLTRIKAEGQTAIANSDKHLLTRINEQLEELATKAIFSNPATWVYQFNKLKAKPAAFTDKREAAYYIEKGEKAIEDSDVDELKRCVRNLINLLPDTEQELANENLAGITK